MSAEAGALVSLVAVRSQSPLLWLLLLPSLLAYALPWQSPSDSA